MKQNKLVTAIKAGNKAFKNNIFGGVSHSHHNHFRPDSHAPIGVMGDHLHHKGGLMVSLRYMDMMMIFHLKMKACLLYS